MRLKGFLGLIMILFSGSSAWAQNIGQVSLSQESYISPDYYSTEKKQFSYLEVSYTNLVRKGSKTDPDFQGIQVELNGQVAPGVTAMSYLNIRQLFWSQQNFEAGRKLHRWSDLDQRWNLGLFQPRFVFNELSPEQQGLTGLFLHLGEAAKAEFTFYASPVFVPDQGANFEVKEGEFVETSPYFRAPPTSAIVMNELRDINYTVNKPEINDVIFQPSYGVQATLGNYLSGPFFQASIASKPSGQLVLGVEQYLSVAGNKAVEVTVTPRIYRHRIASADLRYAFEHFYVSVGAATETPEKPDFKSHQTYTQFSTSNSVSPALGFSSKRFRAELSHLRIDEKPSQLVGPYSSETRLMQKRFNYTSVFQLQAELLLLAKRLNRLDLESQYQRSENGDFTVLTSRLKHRFSEAWSWWGQTQLISVAAVDPTLNTSASPLDAFENNDSFRLGLSYVF